VLVLGLVLDVVLALVLVVSGLVTALVLVTGAEIELEPLVGAGPRWTSREGEAGGRDAR